MSMVEFVIGSRMYGLETINSDYDYMRVIFDYRDHVRPFRQIPDVLDLDNNNTKEYALANFLALTAKGNPNTSEMCALASGRRPNNFEESIILSGMKGLYRYIQESGVSVRFLEAYYGHLRGVRKAMYSRGVTPKRLSHAYRVAYSLAESLETKKIPDFRENIHHSYVLSIKLQKEVKESQLTELDVLTEQLGITLDERRGEFEDSKRFMEWVNTYFEGIYTGVNPR